MLRTQYIILIGLEIKPKLALEGKKGYTLPVVSTLALSEQRKKRMRKCERL